MKKKGILFFIVLLSLPVLAAGIYRLAIPILLFVGISYTIPLTNLSGINKRWKWLKTASIFVGVFIIAIFFRVFIIEIYSIPSGSMEDTLLPGDKVLVNKLVYGPKLPASPYEIPWVNLVWFLRAGASANPDSAYWDYQRLRGFSDIKRGDVAVFSHPLWGGRNNFFIKRCMGLPGDTLAIESGKVKINGRFLPEPALSKKVYEVWPGASRQFSRVADNLGIQSFGRSARSRERGSIEMLLTENRDNSNDSRYWGFVPEENIVGKAGLILFSNNWNGFKWKRLLKPIN